MLALTPPVARRLLLLIFLLPLLVLGGPPSDGTDPGETGLVVEEVEPGGAAARVDLEPGDLLLRWHRGDVSGPPGSPFSLRAVEIGEAPRGEVVLELDREGTRLSLPVPAGHWRIRTRPRLPEPARSLYLEGEALRGAGSSARVANRWRKAVSELEEARRRLDAAWLLARLGDIFADDASWTEAEQTYRRAVATAEAARDARAAARLEERWGEHLEHQGRLSEALEIHRRALERWEARTDPFSRLNAAHHLNILGVVSERHGDLAAAERFHRRALEIRNELAPRSFVIAISYNNLGILAGLQGDYGTTERYLRSALELYREQAPESRHVASTLNNLAVLAGKVGDLAGAEDLLQQAAGIWQKLAPDSPELAASWTNLGQMAHRRGDLVAAEQYFIQALDIEQRRLPGGVEVGATLTELVALALARRNLESAEDYGSRALELLERTSPDSHYLASLLDRLGTLARLRGDLGAAERHLQKALAIRERRAPDNLDIAQSLENLADLDLERGDADDAAEHLRRALALERRLAPTADTTGATLCRLGEALALMGDLEAAAAHFQEALDLLERETADSAETARCHHRQAGFHLRTGNTVAALQRFARSVEALEAQTGRLGGSYEARSGFAADHTVLYRDYLDLLVETGHEKEAFHVQERSRARSFLDLLATRDLTFHQDVPAELWRNKQRADLEYEQTLARLARLDSDGLDPTEGKPGRQELEAALDAARRRQREAQDRIRGAAPRLASLRVEPLAPDAVRKMLDPDTLLLSFSLGERRSHLFALGPEASSGAGGESSYLQVIVLPWGKNELSRDVAHFRRLLRPSRSVAAVRAAGDRLSNRLLQPVANRLALARRVVIIPDGPLHSLPFAALPGPESADAPPRARRWLVEGRPVSVVASATVLAQLRSRPRSHPPGRYSLAAFGDPSYPRTSRTSAREPVLRSVLGRGWRLDPLPATREEVESLGRLFPGRSRIYLGPEATEERVKALGTENDLVHLACHGLLDRRFPLESALALTVPPEPGADRDNGLLQAWEVFEEVRLDAELVTLSGCDTGRGKEFAGEGMLGLTRAFQYAGARSVLASLWSVGDRSTTLLMQRFYSHLELGLRRDEALRRAQLDLLDGTVGTGAHRHPFHWAAFQLYGDAG